MIILPLPPQAGQTVVDCMDIPMKFWVVRTWPEPPHCLQVSTTPSEEPCRGTRRVLDPLDGDFLFTAEGCFFKGQVQPGAYVFGPGGCLLALARREEPPPKNSPKMSPRSPKSPNPENPPP